MQMNTVCWRKAERITPNHHDLLDEWVTIDPEPVCYDEADSAEHTIAHKPVIALLAADPVSLPVH